MTPEQQRALALARARRRRAEAEATSQNRPPEPQDSAPEQVKAQQPQAIGRNTTPMEAARNALLDGFSLGGVDAAAEGVVAGVVGGVKGGVEAIRERDLRAIPRSVGEEWRELRGTEKARDERLAEAHPKVDTVGRVLGAGAGGAGMARTGLTTTRLVPQGARGFWRFGGNTAALAADGAGIAATETILNGDDNAGEEAAQGGALAAGTNILMRGSGKVLEPVANVARGYLGPQSAARRKVADAVERSGQSIDDLLAKFRSAQDDGADEFILADALGRQGQRLASGVARSPGAGGERLVEFLDRRQAGQAGRVARALDEGLGAEGRTADDALAKLVDFRKQQDNANFGKVAEQKLNLDRALAKLRAGDRSAGTKATPTVEDREYRRALGQLAPAEDGTVDMSRLESVRRELSGKRGEAIRQGNDNRRRVLSDILATLDEDAAVVPEFGEALRRSAQMRSVEDAVPLGQKGAKRSRAEDLANTFNGLTPEQQQAYRTGFADPLITKAEGAAEGANKARPLLTNEMDKKIRTVAGGNADRLLRQLERENLMFGTRGRATGGSLTADNLADQQEVNGLLGPIGQLAQGRPLAAAGEVARNVLNPLTGNTEKVREELATMLLARDTGPLTREIAQTIRAGEKLTQAQMATVRAIVAGEAAVN